MQLLCRCNVYHVNPSSNLSARDDSRVAGWICVNFEIDI